MSTKTCFKCGCEKPLSEFYAHKQMADGHLNKCKDCTKQDEFKRRHGEGREKVLAYERESVQKPRPELILETVCSPNGKSSTQTEGLRKYSSAMRFDLEGFCHGHHAHFLSAMTSQLRTTQTTVAHLMLSGYARPITNRRTH